jgi:glycosyltransferase involved in cell wall biosynthesis
MRIAYIAPYQGIALVKRRPIVRNLSLAGRVKTERLAELLQKRSHDVEILSQGEVTERQFKVYPGFSDPELFHAEIPVYYSSAFPVRFLSALWSSLDTLRIFKSRHRVSPYDVVLIYNLKPPQVFCARYAIRRLGLPVILEYEDDAFLDSAGKRDSGPTAGFYLSAARSLLKSVSGCVAVSPHLLSQVPSSTPKLLLRGIVGDEIESTSRQAKSSRNNWVVFSGTLGRTYGLDQLIKAWGMLEVPGWELHIAGQGQMATTLQQMAHGNESIIFHGLLNRQENAGLLRSSKIGINPHDASQTLGNIFAFKIVEYLASDLHLITTPMGSLPPKMEAGVTYMSDNKSTTIAATLGQVIRDRSYEHTAAEATLQIYGPEAVATALDELLNKVMAARRESKQLRRCRNGTQDSRISHGIHAGD